jgi:hypothetical protein
MSASTTHGAKRRRLEVFGSTTSGIPRSTSRLVFDGFGRPSPAYKIGLQTGLRRLCSPECAQDRSSDRSSTHPRPAPSHGPRRPTADTSAAVAPVDQAIDVEQNVTVVADPADALAWVLLAYRVPREPSTPRIAIWRRLRKLGVAQVGDGLVALPADARTTEALEWAADDVIQAGGTATLWKARLSSRASERELVATMAAARAGEYAEIVAKAQATLDAGLRPGSPDGVRRLRLLRRELRGVQRRDFFPPPERQHAQTAMEELAVHLTGQQSAGARDAEVGVS